MTQELKQAALMFGGMGWGVIGFSGSLLWNSMELSIFGEHSVKIVTTC